MVRKVSIFILIVLVSVSLSLPSFAVAQTTRTINAQTLLKKAQLFFSSRSGTFTEGSTFEVPILLNTAGVSVNTVELYIKFDPRKLSIVQPSGDKSIIGIWLKPPSYSNTAGTAKIVGAIPNGIVTNSGVVTTITFKALTSGTANVSILEGSRVLANDGMGTDMLAQFDRATYTIIPKAPDGVRVYSETHPFSDLWNNNNSPVFNWDSDSKITGFSYVIDNEPNTIPDNTPEGKNTVISYEGLNDGLWYFHIKALRNKIWGATTHYLVRIDTTAPAEFVPTQETPVTDPNQPALVSFFTTDSLSGIDHYEVGVMEKNTPEGSSPLFVQTDSPYQVPVQTSGDVRTIVRAFDHAGNVRTASLDINVQPPQKSFLNEKGYLIIIGILALLLLFMIMHYVFSHHIFRRMRRAVQTFEEDDEKPVLQPPQEVKTYVLAGPHDDTLPPPQQ